MVLLVGVSAMARCDYLEFKLSEDTGLSVPSLATYAFAALFSAAAGFGAVYVSWLVYGNGGAQPAVQLPLASPKPVPHSAAPGGAVLAGLNTGDMAAFVASPSPAVLPDLAFVAEDGSQKTFADWRGKVVLLNLWATWCAPCKKEMPSLDRLNAALGGSDFEVVAVSVEKGEAEKAKAFLTDAKASGLALYRDPTALMGQHLKAPGMPATILIGRDGRELGRLIGPAEWDSPEAKALVAAAIGVD